MTKVLRGLGVSIVVVGGVLNGAMWAQSTAASTPTDTPPVAHRSMSPEDGGSYATGKPLDQGSKEGFWGRLNPLARKKWVRRQIDPIQDRTNELDQLQAKNANDIRDVDARSQAGIGRAMAAASAADQHAAEAASRANAANLLAGGASSRTEALEGTVTNLDTYRAVRTAVVPFAGGRTTLGVKARGDLDALAARVANEKGYVVEVRGYSRSGIPASQAMADSVVRYLVTQHGVPIYRIYRTGLGRQAEVAAGGERPLTNGVRVTLLHNSLATMDREPASQTKEGFATPPAEQ